MKNQRSMVILTLMVICISIVTNQIFMSSNQAKDPQFDPSSISVQGERSFSSTNELLYLNSTAEQEIQMSKPSP